MKRKVGVATAETRNEMGLEGLNGPFSCIGPVGVGRNKLKVHSFLVHELF